MPARAYRLVLLDRDGSPLRGAQYMHVSDETPSPGDRIELPGGVWTVASAEATWSGDESATLVEVDHYGGTLICRREPSTGSSP